MDGIDSTVLSFSPESLRLMNVILGLIIFGVALDLDVKDFQQVRRHPRAAIIGLCTQFLLFPFLTFCLAWLLEPQPSIALGMILIASCPGGNVSNYLTHYACGNTALSVSMSSIATLICTLMTPLNVALWGGLYLRHSEDIQFSISFWSMASIVLTILIVPTTLGMLLRRYRPALAAGLRRLLQPLSLVFFIGFVAVALYANWDYFLRYYYIFFSVVILHNLLSIGLGYGISSLAGMTDRDRRAVTLELGIQNSGLGLIIIFSEFDGLGGMAIIAAAWGIWHLVAGISLASYWRYRSSDAVQLRVD